MEKVNMQDLFNEYLKTLLLSNIEDFDKNREAYIQDVQDAVKSYAEKYDVSLEYVIESAIQDLEFGKMFVKKPERQNVTETVSADILKAIKDVKDFEILNKHGNKDKNKKAIIIYQGIISSGELSVADKPKSVDFKWVFTSATGKEYQCFASHKYTKEGGGSQDNQKNDMIKFLQHCLPNNSNNNCFFAICDGDYYYDIHPRKTPKTIIESIKATVGNRPNFFVGSTDSVEEYLRKLP